MSTKTGVAVSSPRLAESALEFRLRLCRQRTTTYPMDRLGFILMDLDRPEDWHRHAEWCAGDLSGRTLEFWSAAAGVDGADDHRLRELFDEIWKRRRPSGLIGRLAGWPPQSNEPPENHPLSAASRLFNGLIRYYDATGDGRGLQAAVDMGKWCLARCDEIVASCAGENFFILQWLTEPFANLYRLTGDRAYLNLIARIVEPTNTIKYCHSHGTFATLRGLQLAALFTGDMSWNEKPERFRREIIDQHYEMADGCIAETFPRSFRNEGCSIADWILMNLYAGLITNDDDAYEHAENALWNALFFNQFITGGFGHRDLTPQGYAMGPMSECWWCCTENGGMAISDYARNAVTLRGQTISINLLVAGTFTLTTAAGQKVIVEIQTRYPESAEATIVVRHCPESMQVRLRVPTCIHNAKVSQTRNADCVEVKLSGKLGHTLKTYQDKVTLRYGPLVLAPMCYYWGATAFDVNTNAPPGYIPSSFPAGFAKLDVGPADADGFLRLTDRPTPAWIYFEEGRRSPISICGASAHVPMQFSNGQRETLWFAPLCHLTSDMSYYETPILFDR